MVETTLESQCKYCARLDKHLETLGGEKKFYHRCLAGRFDEKIPAGTVHGCWRWSTICLPGKAVAAAQKDCPDFVYSVDNEGKVHLVY